MKTKKAIMFTVLGLIMSLGAMPGFSQVKSSDNMQIVIEKIHADKKIDAFVLNEQKLKHLVKGEFPGRVQVLPETFDEYFVSMALQEKSPLRKPTNKALLKFMGTEKWAELMNRNMK